MSVSKRADTGRWRARYRGPDGKQRSKDFDTKAAATTWANEQDRRVRRNEWTDPDAGRATVADMYQPWIDSRELKPKTRDTYERLWRSMVEPRWGKVRLTGVTTSDVRAWVVGMEGLRGGPAGASLRRQAFHVLSGILDTAVADRRLLTNPARVGSAGRAGFLPRVTRTERKRYLSHGDVAALAREAGDYGTLVQLMAYTGLRWGEATALRVGDVDPLQLRIHVERNASDVGGRILYVAPKTHQIRSVPMPAFLRDMVTAQMAGKASDELLFTSPLGTPLRLSNFRAGVLLPACKRAGLRQITAHDLRHTAASLAVSSGADVKIVQRMLGHASAAMTLDVYADLFEDRLDEVADALSEARNRALEASVRPGPPPVVSIEDAQLQRKAV